MAANPNFLGAPFADAIDVTAANTSSRGDGTIGTNIFLVYAAGSAGAFVTHVRCMPTASVAATATTATVVRVFVSSQSSGSTTASDTHLIAEQALPVQTASQTTTAVQPVDIILNRALQANQTLLVTNHHAPAANTAWTVTAFGASYTA